MANAKEIQSSYEKYSGHHEDHQCHVHDFFFQNAEGQKILQDTEPYFYNMQAAIARILRHMPDIQHPFSVSVILFRRMKER